MAEKEDNGQQQQLKELITSLQNREILNNKFDEVMKGLKVGQNPRFAVEIKTKFFRDAESDIAELTTHLGALNINYTKVMNVALKLKETCSSLGCCRMADTCGELRDASAANNREGSVMILGNIRHEYRVLQENLNRIAHLDRLIYENELQKRYY